MQLQPNARIEHVSINATFNRRTDEQYAKPMQAAAATAAAATTTKKVVATATATCRLNNKTRVFI